MRKSLGFLFILVSVIVVGGVLAYSLNADYWLKTPKEKFVASWQSDVRLLRSARKLPPSWDHIREVEVRSDNSPAMEWTDTVKKQIPLDSAGTYKLNVMLIHWIEKNRYGAIIQYSITDLRSGNTIWEVSRTFPLGYLI